LAAGVYQRGGFRVKPPFWEFFFNMLGFFEKKNLYKKIQTPLEKFLDTPLIGST